MNHGCPVSGHAFQFEEEWYAQDISQGDVVIIGPAGAFICAEICGLEL